MSAPIQTTKPIIHQVIEEVIDKKFSEMKIELAELVKVEMRRESERQYEIMRVFMRSIGRDVDDLDRRVKMLEQISFA